MSRFGLFGRLGKKDCNKLKEKGDKQFSKGEFYLSFVAYEDALTGYSSRSGEYQNLQSETCRTQPGSGKIPF